MDHLPEAKIIPFTEFKDNLRQAILATVDNYAREVMSTTHIHGWKDHELPALFLGVDAHAQQLATRINAGHETNSALIHIDMDN